MHNEVMLTKLMNNQVILTNLMLTLCIIEDIIPFRFKKYFSINIFTINMNVMKQQFTIFLILYL